MPSRLAPLAPAAARWLLPLLCLAGAASARAQRPDSTPAAAPLPAAFAARSDGPYLTGTIVERGLDASGRLRVHVVARGEQLAARGRASHAEVIVGADSLLQWRDGRAATGADLAVGRAVVVWVRGPEPRTDPPVVTSSAILVERP